MGATLRIHGLLLPVGCSLRASRRWGHGETGTPRPWGDLGVFKSPRRALLQLQPQAHILSANRHLTRFGRLAFARKIAGEVDGLVSYRTSDHLRPSLNMPTNPRSYPTAPSLRMSKNTSNSSTSAERQPASNYRSCHKCHQRKIRCDKRDPCSPCSRSNAQCAYPPPDERIKRPRKTTMAKVASRLSDLERLLPSVQSTAGEESQVIGSSHPTAALAIQGSSGHEREDCSLHTASLEHRQAFGDEILVRRGSRSQYFSEGFLARVIERVRDLVVTSNKAILWLTLSTATRYPVRLIHATNRSIRPRHCYRPKAHRDIPAFAHVSRIFDSLPAKPSWT
jgi:hypothetical protein